MQQVLVYADSLSWGIIPGTRRRLPFAERWPGVLERSLTECLPDVRVLEDCLNGRRTVFDDPYLPGRSGLHGLAESIEMHSPLSLVILMLGTNDFQSMHPHTAWHAAQGIARLVREIRAAPVEPGMPIPPVLVVVPPPIVAPRGPFGAKFDGAESKCAGLAEAYRAVGMELGFPVFEAGTVTSSSRVDGIHLDADQHLLLGRALAAVAAPLISR
ncbi:MAG: SGNH/GDSL hydrolase family protein [Proteobacteria bacterium]|nr:SGNH/GDSL hydrolase family protein [Pseudomonadota bacterium]